MRVQSYKTVNGLNLADLSVLDFKETDTDHHVQAEQTLSRAFARTAGARAKEGWRLSTPPALRAPH